MRKINLYSFHRGIADYRFDDHNTRSIIDKLKESYEVNWLQYSGGDGFRYQNDCDVVIDQGSIMIFEFDDTKEFKTFDFGDAPTLSVQLSKSNNFIGAAIGQYNKDLWDQTIDNKELREKVKPSIYPESCWQFGIENYDQVSEYRNSIELKQELFWRGSIYKDPNKVEFNRRVAIEHIAKKLPNFYFGYYPLPFDQYMNESIHFKLALCFGVGGGYTCGDFCLRDIELYGLGIPTIRPKYAVETADPLIPDHHYISVECEFDETYRYKDPELLADRIIKRYQEVINDQDYLEQIASNARKWYIDNISHPNITKKIIEVLEL